MAEKDAAFRGSQGLSGDPPANARLTCRGLTVHRSGRPVLNGISIELRPGELLGVLGANGAGKTTLLSALAGELALDPALHRHCPVSINGRELVDMKAAELARIRAVLPQKPELHFDLTVDEVVGMGVYPFPELDPHACARMIRQAMEEADVAGFIERSYLELSGGEQQRVQFARTLVQLLAAAQVGGPAYLFLDEPSASLDPAHQHGLLKAARKAADSTGAGVLIVMHDVNLAAQYCCRIALMAQGNIIACGSPNEVLTTTCMEQTYGTRTHVQAHPVHAQVPLVLFL